MPLPEPAAPMEPQAPAAPAMPKTGALPAPPPEQTLGLATPTPPPAQPNAPLTPQGLIQSAFAQDATVAWGLKQALERQRERESAPSALILQPRLKAPNAIRWVNAPMSMPADETFDATIRPGLVAAGVPVDTHEGWNRFMVRGPWYEGEPESVAVERTQKIVEGKLDSASKEHWNSFMAQLSVGASRVLTRDSDQEAYRNLGPEWYEKMAKGGSYSAMFMPTPLNPPALLVGMLARPLAGLAGRALMALTGSERFMGGMMQGAGYSAEVHPTSGFTGWLGKTFGRDWATKVPPALLNRSDAALRAAGGRVTEAGELFIPPGADKAAASAAKEAFAAVRDAMGSTLRLKVYNSIPAMAQAAGGAGAGAAVGAAFGVGGVIGAPPGSRGEAAGQIPGQIAFGAVLPLALQGALAGARSIGGELAGVARGTSPSVRGFGAAAPEGATYPSAFKNLRAPPPRLLGAPDDVILPGSRPPPAPGGAVFPPISPTYGTPKLAGIPGWNAAQNTALKGTFGEAIEALGAQENLVEADRVAKGLQGAAGLGGLLGPNAGFTAQGPTGLATFVGWQDMSTRNNARPPTALWNIPTPTGGQTTVSSASLVQQGYLLPPLMPQPEEVGLAQTALSAAIRDLAGRDHTAIGQMLGTNHLPVVFGGGGGMQPRDIPRYAHTARWAAGILEEAQRRGTTKALNDALIQLPPPPAGIDGQADPLAMAARLKGLADIVSAGAPDARVGPPMELGAPPDLTGVAPVEITPSKAAAPRPAAEELEGNLAAHAPTPESWSLAPQAAARRQQNITHSLSGGIPFVLGTLQARRPAVLGPADFPEVSITADAEGRLFGTIQNPQALGSQSLVDVTAGLRPLALPSEAGWDFIPNRLAPVAFRLDAKTESLLIDPAETDARRWVRESVRNSAGTALGARHATDPLAFLDTVSRSGVTPENFTALRGEVQRHIDLHKGRTPSPMQAERLAGPDPQPHEIDRQHASMIQDHFAVSAALEATKAEALLPKGYEVKETPFNSYGDEVGVPEPSGDELAYQRAQDHVDALEDLLATQLGEDYVVKTPIAELPPELQTAYAERDAIGARMDSEAVARAVKSTPDGPAPREGVRRAAQELLATSRLPSTLGRAPEPWLIEAMKREAYVTLITAARNAGTSWFDNTLISYTEIEEYARDWRGMGLGQNPMLVIEPLMRQVNALVDAAIGRTGVAPAPSADAPLPTQSAARRLPPLGPNGVRVLKDNLKRKAKINRGWIDLRGEDASSAEAVALLMRPYRDPHYETVRTVYARDGVVLAHEATTSRMVGTVRTATKAPPGRAAQAQAYKQIEESVRRAHRMGANEVWQVHNHPSGVPQPSDEDREMTANYAKRYAEAAAAQGVDLTYRGHVIIDHKMYGQVEATPTDDPGVMAVRGRIAPLSDVTGPDPLVKRLPTAEQRIVSPDQIAQLGAKLVHTPGLPMLLYLSSQHSLRAAEEIPFGLLESPSGLSQHLVGRKRYFGAYAAVLYANGSMKGRLNNSAASEALRAAAAQGHILDVVLDLPSGRRSASEAGTLQFGAAETKPGYRVFEEPPDIRAEALAWAATNSGWSRKPDLFAALTDDEKFASLLARIKGSHLRHEAQLSRLNPARWATKPLRYFRGWTPTPPQQAALNDAYSRRVKLEAGLTRVRTEIKVQKAASSRFKGVRSKEPWKPVPLAELLKLHPAELDEWLAKDPEMFHATVRNVWPSLDGAFADAAHLAGPAEQGKPSPSEGALSSLETLKDVVRGLSQEAASVPPDLDKPWSPLAGIARSAQRARGSVVAIRSTLASWQRPSGAIGPRKQTAGFHPGEIKRLVDSGAWDRGLYQAGLTGALKASQAELKARQEFDLLAQAAGRNPRLNKALSYALEYSLNEVAGELDRPEYTFTTRIRGTNVTTRLSEWLPKLRTFYDGIIAEAEREVKYRQGIEKAQHHADTLTTESELRRRQLDAARLAFPGDPMAAWGDIPPEYLTAIHEALMEADPIGDPDTIAHLHRRDADGIMRYAPQDLGAYSYKSLHTLHRQSVNEYKKRKDSIAAIESGALRQKGYTTRLHALVSREIRDDLQHNPYSRAYRYASPALRNRFLEERTSELPVDSWLDGWNLYIPTTYRKIHLEPALMRMNLKLPELDTAQRNYVLHWMGSLKGTEPPLQILLNRAAFESGLHQPMFTDYVMQAATGHNPDEFTKAAKADGSISPHLFSDALHNATGLLYLTLIGPKKIGLLSLTEFSFLARALSVDPIDAPYSAAAIPMALAKTAAGGLGEVISWARNFDNPNYARYYSEPTLQGVTDFLHEIEDSSDRYRPGSFLHAVARVWGPINKSVEFMLRGTTYYTFLDRFRRQYPDAPPEFQKRWAADATRDNIGSFQRRDISPYTAGPGGRAMYPLRRFSQTHVESLTTTAQGTFEALRGLVANATGAKRLQGPPWTPDPNAGMGGAPPPPPPDVPGSAYETWDPGEREAWETINQPVATFGTSMPAGPTAARKLLFQAMLGLPASAIMLWYLGTLLLGSDDGDDDRLYSTLLPLNLQALNEIPLLYWYPETWDSLNLAVKRATVGLNARESLRLAKAHQELLWDIPILGRQIRDRGRAARERDALYKPLTAEGMSGGISEAEARAMADRSGLVQKIRAKLPPDLRKTLDAIGPTNVRRKVRGAAWNMLPEGAQRGLTNVDTKLNRLAEQAGGQEP